MEVNKITQRFGGVAVLALAGICVCLIIMCTRYAKKAKEAELSLGVVLITQEGLMSSEIIVMRSLLQDSFDGRKLKPALALKYMRDAKALKAHVLFMEKHGIKVTAEMEFAEKNLLYASMLAEKHKSVSSGTVFENKEEQGQRRVVLPLPK